MGNITIHEFLQLAMADARVVSRRIQAAREKLAKEEDMP